MAAGMRFRLSRLSSLFSSASILLACAACSSGPGRVPPAGAVSAFWQYPVEKSLPAAPARDLSGGNLRFSIAGNEYEMAAVVLLNGGSTPVSLSGVEIPAAPGGLRVSLYWLADYRADRRSRWFDFGKSAGAYPDACVPIPLQERQDGYFWKGGDRLEIPPGGAVRLLSEWYSPRGNSARFSGPGSLRLLFDGAPSATLSYAASGTGFSLPWEPSYRTAVGIDYATVIDRHRALRDSAFDARALWLEYLRVLGDHRLFPYDADPEVFPAKPDGTVDWDEFQRFQGALLDGTLFADVPPATSVRLKSSKPYDVPEGSFSAYLADIGRVFREKGWLDRLYYYTDDEPLLSQYEDLKRSARRYKALIPSLKVLATEPYSPLLENEVDIWCPDVVGLGDSIPFMPLFAKGTGLFPDFHLSPVPSVYAVERARGKDLWLYTCMSAQFLDYPNLFIDSPASYQRVIPWIMRKYGATGFLYYNAAVAYRKGDPWKDQFDYGANGDGTLLYPGTAEQPFLDRHCPVASLRLKLLRDGFEDYEYLGLLEKRGTPASEIGAIVDSIVGSSLSFQKRLEPILAARERMIDELSR